VERQQWNQQPPALERQRDRNRHGHTGGAGDREHQAHAVRLRLRAARALANGALEIELGPADRLVADGVTQFVDEASFARGLGCARSMGQLRGRCPKRLGGEAGRDSGQPEPFSQASIRISM
jgi:hypothetical protein